MVLMDSPYDSWENEVLFEKIGARVLDLWLDTSSGHALNVQARTKYLRKTLDFMWNSALREKFNFYFQGVFC